MQQAEPVAADADSDPDAGFSPIIGYLGATGGEGSVVFSAEASDLVGVDFDGTVYVMDEPGLSEYIDASGPFSLTVYATDSIFQQVASAIVLDKKNDSSIPSSYMYVEGNSASYTPTTSGELIAALNDIAANGDQIVTLVIKGHASGDGISVGGGEFLTTAAGTIYIHDTDVGELLIAITNEDSKIYFRGCLTAPLAQSVSANLDGARVWGARGYAINVPGTAFARYAWISYVNGQP